MSKKIVISLLFMLIFSDIAFAAHPLITDDTGTQGKGKLQLEFTSEYGEHTKNGVVENLFEIHAIPVLSYGLSDETDIVLGLAYISLKTEAAGETVAVRGTGDASVELKARFYEKHGLSLALKPGIGIPVANEGKGPGNGKTSISMFLISTKEAESRTFHFNAGYIRNEYKLQAVAASNRRDIWHVSLASQLEIIQDLNIVANAGMERNSDIKSNVNPVFLLGGLIYAVNEKMDIDLGIKKRLNHAGTGYSILAGITWKL